MPGLIALPPDTRQAGQGNPPGDMNQVVDALTAMGALTYISPSGDTTGVTDTANVAAVEARGGIVYFAPGTFWGTGVVKKTGTIWQGAGRGQTIWKLPAAANAPLLVSDQFSSLTMTGSVVAGVTGLAIRDIVFDGNASAQTVPAAAGVQIYGYDYVLENVSVRNFLAADALYTEWGLFGGAGLAEKAMESRFSMLRIHDNTLTGAGWHCRGPHDSHVFGSLIYSNTTNAYGYWGETTGGGYAATGLSGTAVSSTPATITVVTTLGLPSAGSVTAPSAGGTVTITYTGVTATTLTGCVATGGSGNYTSNTLTAPGYAGSANLIHGMHIWGNHSIGAVVDCETHFANCEIEGAVTGQLLVRAGNCTWDGGKIFYPTSGAGYGVQCGDTTNKCTALNLNNPVLSGFTGAAAGAAALNIVNTASGSYSATIFTTSTNQQVYGTLQPYERRRIAWGGTTITPGLAAGAGAGTGPTLTFSNGTDHRGTVNITTGTSPAAGTMATVTFAQPKPGTPEIGVWPKNSATAALQPYVSNTSSTGFSISFGGAPTAATAYVVGYGDAT